MPVNIASSDDVSLSRLVEFAAYNTDDANNGLLEIIVAGIFYAKKPADISVLIEGNPENLRDRSEIWTPNSEFMLPALTNLSDENRLLNHRIEFPYKIETLNGNKVNAELGNGGYTEIPVERLGQLSVEHRPIDSTPDYTIAKFGLEGRGLSLVTFGYRTREGVSDLGHDNDESLITLRGFDGVVKEVSEKLKKSNPEGFKPWDNHRRYFQQYSLSRNFSSGRDIRHILILATLRGSTIYTGMVYFKPLDANYHGATNETIVTTNDNWGKIVYLQLNERDPLQLQIAKPGCFGREIPEGDKYALKP